jgi:Zn-finger nucleic acid-binding protein
MDAFHIELRGGDAAEVDQCPGCASVFLDYFDGEPAELAREIERAGRHRPGVASAPHLCPVCRVPLVLSPYLEVGPEIYRCGTCGGAFLTPVQLGFIADFRPTTAAKKKSLRLLDLLDRWLGR